MLLPINIDVSEFMGSFSVSDEDIKQFTSDVVSGVASDFHAHWEKAADILGQTRQEYQRSIYIEKIDDFNYVVGLVGWLPNAIEQGHGAFDQKEWFEKSDKVKYNKDGDWYLTIPFRQGAEGTIGESSVFTGTMPSEVYAQAKKLKPTESLKASSIPSSVQEPIPKPRLTIPKSKAFEEYQRKHSIYEGIKRKEDDKGRGTYVSFRRVGENSDDGSWIHPGFEAKNLAEKAFETMDIAATVDLMAEQFIEQL
jgi:hypothetical protein